MADLKDFMNSINMTKENLIRNSDSRDAATKQYPAFVVSRSLSYHRNLINIVNELNMCPVGNQEHYEFLLNIIPKGKRWASWAKPENTPLVKLLVEKKGMSYEKAIDIAHILKPDQIEAICKDPEYGGVIK